MLHRDRAGFEGAIEVFADITCPFTHVGLRRFVDTRDELGDRAPLLLVSAWPLELVNGAGHQGAALAPKVDALRRTVAPDLFAGFDADRFPTTSIPALSLVAAAYGRHPVDGERLSLALRTALFEEGADISDPAVLESIIRRCGMAGLVGDEEQVIAEWHRGQELGVIGSPHFFTPDGDFFCPSLQIAHEEGALSIAFDSEGFDTFLSAVWPRPGDRR